MNIRQLASLAACVAFGTSMLEPRASIGAESGVLEEIIVTAQRRAENLQKVPVSVTAISADELDTHGLNDVNQLYLVAPSIQLGTDNTVSIRGIGTLAFTNSVDTSVATAVDDVNLGRTFLNGGIFNDVAQVEVLNGPQGLLFGKNATAGLLNITTVMPKIGVFEGKSEMQYVVRDTTPGHGSSVIGTATLNLPISGNSALRLNLDYASQDPVAKINSVAGNPRVDQTATNYGLRAKYLLQLTDDVSIYVIGHYNREVGVAGVFDRTYRLLGAGSSYIPEVPQEGTTPGPNNLSYGDSGNLFRTLIARGVEAKATYVLPNGYQLSNIAALDTYALEQNIDLDLTKINFVDTNHTNESYRQYSEELRFTIPDSERISGQAGLYFFALDLHEQSVLGGLLGFSPAMAAGFPFCVGATPAPGPPPNCNVSNSFFLGNDEAYQFKNRSSAAFGQFDFKLTNAIKLIAGARFTHDQIGIHLLQGQLNEFVPLGPTATRSQSDGVNNFSWKLGAQQDLTHDAMVYATYARGYKGPGYDSSPATPTAKMLVNPETVDSVEVGARTSWLDQRLILNASLFHEKFNNYQVQSFNTVLQSFVLQNAASLTARGAEISIEAKPVRALTVNASLSLLDSKFNDFAGAQCYPGQSGCDSAGTFNAGGLQTPQSSKFAASMGATYDFQITGSVKGFLEANNYYRSAINYQISRAPLTEVGGLDLIGASIGASSVKGWRVALFCKNCTDRRVPTGLGFEAGDASSGIATVIQSWGFNSVRNIGVTAAYKF